MPITDPVLGASGGRAHVSNTLPAIHDVTDREVIGCTGWITTVECG